MYAIGDKRQLGQQANSGAGQQGSSYDYNVNEKDYNNYDYANEKSSSASYDNLQTMNGYPNGFESGSQTNNGYPQGYGSQEGYPTGVSGGGGEAQGTHTAVEGYSGGAGTMVGSSYKVNSVSEGTGLGTHRAVEKTSGYDTGYQGYPSGGQSFEPESGGQTVNGYPTETHSNPNPTVGSNSYQGTHMAAGQGQDGVEKGSSNYNRFYHENVGMPDYTYYSDKEVVHGFPSIVRPVYGKVHEAKAKKPQTDTRNVAPKTKYRYRK